MVKRKNDILLIGVIGQGFVGGNLSDNLEMRGLKVVRYSLEKKYQKNKNKVKKCLIVFIAVPTLTIKEKFVDVHLRSALDLVGNGCLAIIKSTVPPQVLRQLSNEYKKIKIMHNPEFLTESTAWNDTCHPERNIIGISDVKNKKLYLMAEMVLKVVLPYAPFNQICTLEEASLIKYGGNCFFYFKNVFFNLLHDVCDGMKNVDMERVRNAIASDPRIGPVHTYVSHKGGRGAGGKCLIKDFSAFKEFTKYKFRGQKGYPQLNYAHLSNILDFVENINRFYLSQSKKDIDLLRQTYYFKPRLFTSSTTV